MLSLRLPNSWIPAVAGLTGVFATLALQQPAPAPVAPPAPNKTFLDFITPMHMMLSADLGDWVAGELESKWGDILINPIVDGIAAGVKTELKNRTAEWAWSDTNLQWTGPSGRLSRAAPPAKSTLRAAMGYGASDDNKKIYASFETNLESVIKAALEPYVGYPVGWSAMEAAVAAVEGSIPRVGSSWICIYNRSTGTFQWYNTQAGTWGGPSL
jgi:hypothetical protein